MARGRGAGRNALSEAKVGELIRGNQEALQKQASVGGNVKTSTDENVGPMRLQRKLGISPSHAQRIMDELKKIGKTDLESAKKLLEQTRQTPTPTASAPTPATTPAPTPAPATTPATPAATTQGLQKTQPNNTQPLTALEAQAEIAANTAAERAFKDYLQTKMDRAAFDSDQAAEKAKQEAFERFVRGKQSAAGAAASAANPAASAKAKKNPKSTEPKGEEKEKAAAERPWWQSSGSGPRFLFGGGGAGGEAFMGGGAVEAREAAGQAGALALLRKKQARAGGGATPPPSPPPPAK
jgi:hypothetical protein